MATASVTEHAIQSPATGRRFQTWRNVARFLLRRLLTLALTVVSAVYLTIVIANLGGYVDTIVAARIEEQVGFMMRGGWMSELPTDDRMAAADDLIASLQDAAGLNDPFLLRTARWLGDGLLLNWGEPERSRAYGLNMAGKSVADVIADNLSRTLLVFGVANLFLFGVGVLLALVLNRRHGGLLDRAFILLSPVSSAPAWVFGILLSTVFLRFFGFSAGGTFDTWPDDFRPSYIWVMLRHLLLPFTAVFLAGLFQSVYTWRSFFQVYRNEDYVEMAYAKGLRNGRIDRAYIIRPALPALLTSFALLLAVLWQEVIALEYFFNVQGLGRLFVSALTAYDTPMIVAIVTTFAYLLALTVLLLDLCYVLVDPRVRVGSQAQSAGSIAQQKRRFRWWKRPSARLAAHAPAGEAEGKRPWFPRIRLGDLLQAGLRLWRQLAAIVRELRQYRAAILGLIIIGFLLAVSVYTVVTIPYGKAITLWRGDDNIWYRNPREALPAWVNFFRIDDLPPTLTYSSRATPGAKQTTDLGNDLTDMSIPFTFEYPYAGFPQEIILDMTASYQERGPHVTVSWVWPDGSERELTSFQPRHTETYFVGRDTRLQRRLRSDFPQEVLFLGPDGEATAPVKGSYTLRIDALHFEPGSDIDVDVTILGQVYGWAGTDSQRRDLMIAVLWGTPIALAFGLIAAFATSVGGMLIAAIGAWYGGMVDRVVEFLTEVNLILPFFPVSLMVFILYSRSIVTILIVTVALTLFGSSVKTYRAAFLQIRSSAYIEAAQAYGAGNWRIVVRYMIPRIATVLVPKLIILVPSYVFLEATLAFLGVTDPYLPTWGKLVVAALSYGVHTNSIHLVLVPLGLLFVTGFAFAMVGMGLERIFEPRLREM